MNYESVKWCAAYLREHGEGQENPGFIAAADELDRIATAWPKPAPSRLRVKKRTLRRLAWLLVLPALAWLCGVLLAQGFIDTLQAL